ncbi:MAG: hypothetical protein J7J51_01860 [Candidatus Omnitrophica bacterium]|nr:hypothetical protein [Candidatus Omnitrophota bacterium]
MNQDEIRNFPQPATRNPLPENGQIVIFLVFLLAVLLAFMGGIISVGNKSLRNLRMQNAADAAALAGTACLARGLNSMANLTATKFNPEAAEEEKKSLVYPFYPYDDADTGNPLLEIRLQSKGEFELPIHENKELYFDALPKYPYDPSGITVINQGEEDWEKAAALPQSVLDKIIFDPNDGHLSLIQKAIDATKKEYVGGGDFDFKISEMAKKIALENGYNVDVVPEGDTWEPEWEEPENIDIKYSYWLEHRPKSKSKCGGFNCASFCWPCQGEYSTGRCCRRRRRGGCIRWRHYCHCKRCWTKEQGSTSGPFWVKGEPRSTEVRVRVESTTGASREARGEVTNIYSGSNPNGGQIFPPQPNFKIQLSE